MSGRLYAGTSGFSYPAWAGTFYPRGLPASRRLEYYASRLDAVELNGTFYRMPEASVLAGWADQTPPGFRFSLKAHRMLTYGGRRFDRAGFARDFGERAQALGERLGAVLLQFPPTRELDLELLESLLAGLGVPAAAEFRHPSWLVEPVYACLRARGAALVVTDQERWPQAPVLELGPLAYFRLRRDYDEAALTEWARVIAGACARHEAVHVHFPHDVRGPARASSLRALVAAASAGSGRG